MQAGPRMVFQSRGGQLTEGFGSEGFSICVPESSEEEGGMFISLHVFSF